MLRQFVRSTQCRIPPDNGVGFGSWLQFRFQFGNSLYQQILKTVFASTCLLVLTGCEPTAPAKFRLNSVEWLKQERLHNQEFSEEYKTEVGSILTALFGTPDDPEFPYLLGDEDPAQEIIKLDNLKMAAGPVAKNRLEQTTGLFREHCSHCHGITGDGAGPTAATLNPYPRDFRLGKFKFKSTPLRQPPTDEDLMTTLKNGIPGSAMPSFRTLPDQQLEALVDYVKYLTIRGQFERYLLSELAGLGGKPLIDLSLIKKSTTGEEPPEADKEEFEDQMYGLIGDGLQDGIIKRWLNPDRKVTEIPPAPQEFDGNDPGHDQFVKTGRALFYSKGNCVQCHGETGAGDGQAGTYDDWTNEWYKIAAADPDTYGEFLEAGALPARPIRPRNLNLPVYSGGDHPNDLYLRLANGIEGTPMPASTALTSDEIWALVAYVKSLPFSTPGAPDQQPPVNEKEIARQP